MATPVSTDNPVLEAVREIAPRIEAAGPEIEQSRRLPAWLVRDLVNIGVFHMLVPRSLGGGEMPLTAFADVMEELAKADGSTAWCVGQASGCSVSSAFLPFESADEIFGVGRGIAAWGPDPRATAVAVEGGYRVTGNWSFASGMRQATWLGAQCALLDSAGQKVIRADGLTQSIVGMVPAGETEMTDIWDVSGLRGTASDAFSLKDHFVPAHRVAGIPWEFPREPGPLYRFPSQGITSIFTVGFSSVALGLGRAMLDAFVDLAANKTPRGATGVLKDNAVIQSNVAQAEASLRSARAFLHQTVDEVWAAVCETGEVTLDHRISIRLASTHAIHRAMQVADMAFHAAGATAIFTSNPFERRFRDIHALSQQIQGRTEHYETVGQYLLGVELGTKFWL